MNQAIITHYIQNNSKLHGAPGPHSKDDTFSKHRLVFLTHQSSMPQQQFADVYKMSSDTMKQRKKNDTYPTLLVASLPPEME